MNLNKEAIYNKCRETLNLKIKRIEQAIEDARNAANDDTKSTAGDKHETNRAMMHLEQEKNARQLTEYRNLEKLLLQIDPTEQHSEAQLGSLVLTNRAIFYISISLGKIMLMKQNIMLVSLQSPIGKQMASKRKGDFFQVNGISYKTEEVI